jgi:ribosomal protein S18 acetylase RimI-like enzyme
MTTKAVIANGFLVRTPTLDDVKPAYEVVHACDMTDDGKPDHTLEDFQLAWQEPDFNLATDAWCVVTSDKDLHIGWVNQLAVLRPWRRKGLGIALLLHSFAEFYRRGIVNVGLGVDAQNLTGATRLYERAGMHVALQHDTYEKELRAGQELSTQSISL